MGAKSIGENNQRKFNELVKSTLIIDFVLGLIIIVAAIAIAPFMLAVIYGFTAEMFQTAYLFLVFDSPYIVLTLFTFTFTNLLKVKKQTKFIMIFSTMGTALQICLSLLFIEGLFGFPRLGVIGAALAICISLFTTLVCYAILLRDTLYCIAQAKARYCIQILRFSLPLSCQEILEGVLFITLFEILIARLGIEILAIYSIGCIVMRFVQVPTFMYANSVTVFTGEQIGKKNFRLISKIINIAVSSSYFFYFVISSIMLIFVDAIADIWNIRVSNESARTFALIIIIGSILFPIYENMKNALFTLNQGKKVTSTSFIVNIIVMAVLAITSFSGSNNLYIMYGGLFVMYAILSLSFVKIYRKCIVNYH